MSIPPDDGIASDLLQSATRNGLVPTPSNLNAAEAGVAGSEESAVGCTDCNEREVILKENIIVIGSENFYNGFWSKMMFIAPAVAMATRGIGFRGCDVKTVLYVSDGYTRSELLPVENLRGDGFKVEEVSSAAEIVAYMNNRPERVEGNVTYKTKVHGMYIFCHGFPGRLTFNLTKINRFGWSSLNMDASDFAQVSPDKMTDNAEIVSYACRTGIAVDAEEFTSLAAARPEDSLAQTVATQLDVTFKAFYTRTYFKTLISPPDERDGIAAFLKTARETYGEHQIIEIPPHYEALPHPGQGGRGARADGTAGFSLWRKGGATGLPYGHTTPTGLPNSIQTFNP